MNEHASLLSQVLEAWRALPLGLYEKLFIKAVVLGVCIYFVIYVIERACGTRTDNYRSKGFLHDSMYWIYFEGGFNAFFVGLGFRSLLTAYLEEPLSFFDVKLLTPLPFFLQAVIFLVVSDFINYWVHRAEHRYKFMWAFHTTHHSQEKLTFATTIRQHPVTYFYQELSVYIPMRILGVDPMSWLPLFILQHLITASHHSQIPLNFGPLNRVIVTPSFHSYHHSTDPAHHNKNFSGTFAAWDYLFGTAVKDGIPKPTQYGLDDVKPTSLWSTLATPFRLLYQFYLVRDRTTNPERLGNRTGI